MDKIHRKNTRMCLTKHTLSKKQLGPVGPEVQTRPTFFLGAGSSPAIQAGLDPPARSVTGPS